MKPTTFEPISHAQATSTGTTDIETLTAPAGASVVWLQCATTSAWVTFDGTDPAADNKLLLIKDQQPLRFDVSTDVKVASSAGANSVVDAFWAN